MWFIGVEVEQETSAPPLKKNPGSAPGLYYKLSRSARTVLPHSSYSSCQYLAHLAVKLVIVVLIVLARIPFKNGTF